MTVYVPLLECTYIEKMTELATAAAFDEHPPFHYAPAMLFQLNTKSKNLTRSILLRTLLGKWTWDPCRLLFSDLRTRFGMYAQTHGCMVAKGFFPKCLCPESIILFILMGACCIENTGQKRFTATNYPNSLGLSFRRQKAGLSSSFLLPSGCEICWLDMSQRDANTK